MTTQEAIDLMKLMLSDNKEIYSIKEIEALEIVIRAAEKQNKYRKKAKRFKRKWLGLRINVNEFVQAINHEYLGRELENKKLFNLMNMYLVNPLSDKL